MSSTERTKSVDAVYSAVLESIRDEIQRGVRSPGSLLPGEKELARIHGMSRWAVREMLDRLVADGMVQKIAGKGTVVNPRELPGALRDAIVVDFIIDYTNKLDANEYAENFVRLLASHATSMRRTFEFSYRLADFTGREQDDLETIRRVKADATVIIPFSRQCRDFLEMYRGNVTGDRLIMTLAGELSTKGVVQVFVDDVDGVRRGTRYLRHIGHRRIAMIAPDDYCYRNGYSLIRQQTFIDEMRKAGCDWTAEMTSRVECAYVPVRAVVAQWMGRKEPPTAMFVADGNWMSPVKAALDLLGKRVPGDVTLICYDDVMEAGVADPPVTVVRQRLDAAARRVFEVVTDHVERKPSVVVQHRIAPELVVRDSSAPPAG